MNTVTNKILQHCGGETAITAMTNCMITASNDSVTLIFSKLVGASSKKISHLDIAYNSGTDLYDITGYKLNKRTFDLKTVVSIKDVFVGDLQKTCENICQLKFTLS